MCRHVCRFREEGSKNRTPELVGPFPLRHEPQQVVRSTCRETRDYHSPLIDPFQKVDFILVCDSQRFVRHIQECRGWGRHHFRHIPSTHQVAMLLLYAFRCECSVVRLCGAQIQQHECVGVNLVQCRC